MDRRTQTLLWLVTLAVTHHAFAQNPTISLIPLVDDVRRECVGGPNDGQACSTTSDCEVGPECQRVCDNGPDAGTPCTSNSDCIFIECKRRCVCNYVIQAAPGDTITTEIFASDWSLNGEKLIAWEADVDMLSASSAILPVGWDHPIGISHDCFSDDYCTTLCVGGGRLEGFNCRDDIDCGDGTCSEPSPFPICTGFLGICVGPNHDPSLGAFVDTSRSDYVFFGSPQFGPAIDFSTLNYRFGSGVFDSENARVFTSRSYLGTLVLRVLPDAAGRAVIPLGSRSALVEPPNSPMEPLDTEGLTIEIVEPPPPPETIPTTSTWGVTVLALTLLVGAKVYFGRRNRVAL